MKVPIGLVLSTFPFYWTIIQSQGLDQPPRFILEPQDAVLPTVIGTNSVSASIHCSHNSVNTTVTWFRNGVPLTYTANRILRDNGTVEFRPLIAAVDVTTEGVRYFCVLSNAFGSVISRTALLQSATFGTEWSVANAPTSGVDVTLGSFVLLPCDPPAANPPPNVVWTRDGAVLDTGDTSKYKVLVPEAGGGLIIANVISNDIGPIYRCRVANALVFATRDSPFSYQLNQIESYPEDFTIYDTLESTYTLTTGSDAEFTCLAFGNNVNTFEFIYLRLDGDIPNNVQRTSSDATTIDGHTTMRITSVTVANSGMYQCIIRNLTSRGDSLLLGTRNFTIQVSVAPAITSVPSDQVYNTGETHTLQCTATGFPAPVISYYFNATLITSGVSNGVLTLTNVTTANTGPYQCFADNVRAETSPLWIINVNPADNGDGSVARDPHFFLPLINGDHMCFSIQGEPDFAFNLIKDKYILLNAQFVLPAEDESHTVSNVSTFLGDLALAITDPETGNVTIVRVSAPDHSVQAGHILTIVMDKPVYVDVSKSVTIKVDTYAKTTKLKDESAWLYINTDNFGIKVRFYKKHLDIFLTKTKGLTKDAHGLIGQFLATDVKIDTENMLMQLGNRKPILVKRGKAWPFLGIDKECWYPKSTDVQQPEVIEGIYTDYIVEQLIPN